jgi:hypothetical protein
VNHEIHDVPDGSAAGQDLKSGVKAHRATLTIELPRLDSRSWNARLGYEMVPAPGGHAWLGHSVFDVASD